MLAHHLNRVTEGLGFESHAFHLLIVAVAANALCVACTLDPVASVCGR